MIEKGLFVQKFDHILSRSPLDRRILLKYELFLLEILGNTKTYGNYSRLECVKIVAKRLVYGGRSHKFLVLTAPEHKDRVIFKGTLLEQLYPKVKKSDPTVKQATHRYNVLEVLRKLIHDQIVEFRQKHRENFTQLVKDKKHKEARAMNICPLSGKFLTFNKTAVDHVIPFIKLVDDWLSENGLSFESIKLKGRGSKRVLHPSSLNDSWISYHKDNAVLQLVCHKANLQEGSKGYNSVTRVIRKRS